METIISILEEYSQNNDLIDEEAYYQIFNILKENYNIDDINLVIVKSFKFSPDEYKLGLYNNSNKTLSLFYYSIILYLSTSDYLTRFDYDYKFNNNEKMLRKNLSILRSIIHEFEHVKQFKNRYIFDESLENKLVYIGTKNNKIAQHHSEIYRLSPIERLANVNAYENIIRILDNKYNNLKHVYENILTEYDNKILKENVIRDYSYEDRLKYGLYLTDGELENNRMLLKKKL